MKYFSLNCVKNAYELVSANTKDKFWGILGILYSIDSLARPGVNFSINTEKLSTFLEQTFRLKDKKTYNSPSSEYSVVFANNWEAKTADNFILKTPNIFPIIVWAYRGCIFDKELSTKELLEKFINDFHISKESVECFFSISYDSSFVIEYSDTAYNDEDLFKVLGGAIGSDLATIKMNKSFVVANAGDLSRGPFFQPLYASLNTLECLIIFPFDAKEYYQVFNASGLKESKELDTTATQTIYYGCPGSGKSHMVNRLVKGSFLEYLLSRQLSESSCNKYANVLKAQWIVDIAKKSAVDIESLYDTEDIKLINKVLENLKFIEKDEKGQRMYSTALKHYVDYLNKKKNIFRTTFHPDTDYASFVGCYKPTMDGDKSVKQYKKLHELKIEADAINGTSGDKVSQIVAFVTKYAHDLQYIVDTDPNIKSLQNLLNKTLSFANETYLAYVIDYVLKTTEVKITYKFCPQVFTNAYVKAWQNPGEKIYLIIEEINRGNCAQIFGDLFQLLDRDKVTGKSEYPIKADKDLVAYIEKALGVGHEGIKNGELCLPSNLIIYATMNTSDQSLFPMDSAFKRRWDWEYVPINYSKDIDSGKFIINIAGAEYLWVDFLEKVNDKIYDATNSEDKQMGNFFIKKSVDAKEFINKVMFYLWNEVCKEEYGTQRNFFRKGKDGKTEFKFTELFGANQTTILNEFMTSLGVEPTNKPNPEEPAAE